MDLFDIVRSDKPYVTTDDAIIAMFMKLQAEKPSPNSLGLQEFNQTGSFEFEKRGQIMSQILGDWNEDVRIEPVFKCDFGFNIHFHGPALVNYNCVFLDTSPINIGKNVLFAPGVCLTCATHSLDAEQRAKGVRVSAPITVKDNAWIGANATVLGGVTIGEGSIIGAGSVVTKDIPDHVVAVGNPCRVLRKITEEDVIPEEKIIFS